MRSLSSASILVSALALAACTVHETRNYPPSPYPHGSSNPPPARGVPLFHVSAGAATAIPAGAIGYLVTANGQGGYRLAWTDTAGTAAHFHGSVFTNGVFDPSQLINVGAAYVTLVGAQRIDFDSVPGANVDTIDFVPSTDPIYLDVLIDNGYSGFAIYFTDASTGIVSSSGGIDPIAFTSP